MALETALWSLKHSAGIWADAMAASAGQDFVLTHPDAGRAVADRGRADGRARTRRITSGTSGGRLAVA